MKLFQPGELRLLWPFYLDAVLSPMLYFAPAFFVLYFRGINLTITQISILIAIGPLFSLISEVPTGAFADLYGRKASVLLSYFLAAIGYGMLIFFKDFFALAAVFAFIGIAMTFSSGAKEAWVFDLIRNRSKSLFAHYTAKIQAINAFGLIASGLLGVLLVKIFGLFIIWPAVMFSYFVSFAVLLAAREKKVQKDTHVAHTITELAVQASTSLKFCWKKAILLKILVAGAIILFALNFASVISWTPFLTDVGLPDYAFGYIWSVMALASMLSAVASHVFLKPGKERAFILASIILVALVSSVILFVNNLAFVVIVFASQCFFIDLMHPSTRVYFHRFIPSKLRATIGSVEGMLLSLVGIISMPISGILVDSIGARYTIFLTALLLMPAAAIYFLIKEK